MVQYSVVCHQVLIYWSYIKSYIHHHYCYYKIVIIVHGPFESVLSDVSVVYKTWCDMIWWGVPIVSMVKTCVTPDSGNFLHDDKSSDGQCDVDVCESSSQNSINFSITTQKKRAILMMCNTHHVIMSQHVSGWIIILNHHRHHRNNHDYHYIS